MKPHPILLAGGLCLTLGFQTPALAHDRDPVSALFSSILSDIQSASRSGHHRGWDDDDDDRGGWDDNDDDGGGWDDDDDDRGGWDDDDDRGGNDDDD